MLLLNGRAWSMAGFRVLGVQKCTLLHQNPFQIPPQVNLRAPIYSYQNNPEKLEHYHFVYGKVARKNIHAVYLVCVCVVH